MSVFGDFEWGLRGVRVRETGAYIPFNLALAYDVWRGGLYIVAEALRPRAPRAPIAARVTPRWPRPWYLIWGTLRQANLRASEAPQAELTFSDQTYIDHPQTGLNSACTDISKSYVADIFEAVFGYALRVDPKHYDGSFVVKSELNGAHDGRIAEHPEHPQDGWVYQRLIDNRTDHGTVADFRCPTVFGQIPLIFIKERPEAKRFANLNTHVTLTTAEAHFTLEEKQNITRFCEKMGLDWGGLDILRDKSDGRIYIVDVNKTDMGPPLALPLRQKLASTKILGRALRAGLEARLP